MDFTRAVKFVLEIEGGDRLVDHPQDPGGLTKFGISLRAFPQLGREGIVELTEEKAIDLYRRHYWDVLQVDQLPERLRLGVFDAAVNHGPVMAVKLLQRSLSSMGTKLSVDGDLGPKTLAVLQKRRSDAVLVGLLLERQRCYRRLESYKTFGFGWERRIIEVAINS